MYEEVWKDNVCRDKECIFVWDIIYWYGSDYKVIFVGDVIMGFYEIMYLGGSVEYWNEESGSVWM